MNAQTDGQVAVPEMPAAIDQARRKRLTQEIRDHQNLAMGIVGGTAAAAAGAAVWAVITYLTNYQIGWMAVGVGCLVGIAVRHFGKGIDTSFGIIGAVLSLAGCLAGNLLTYCLVISRQEGIPFLELLSRLNGEFVMNIMSATFSPMDLLFYGIAVYEGYRLSFRGISNEELAGTAI